jgi:hypothetical protein
MVHAQHNHSIKIGNKSFKRVKQDLGITLTNPNFTNEKIKEKRNSRNAIHNAVQMLLSYTLLSETIKIKLYLSMEQLALILVTV